ncbi:MAG: class I SAM-dependent methyltransferase [Lachnospiraceae bacterium]|nr:class I SAM-dependent methyltransferase [Lachnospiraceae bacterium]
MENEVIGRVTLNYKHYSGQDLYSDGAIEDDLLRIATEHTPEEFPKVVAEEANWPVLYHFSELRGNIVEWIPMEGNEKVLEVGSGCGAITGTLARKAGSVTCVDLSRKRSLVNANRNQEVGSDITIHVGNFQDIEPELPCDFDFIFLIGVFEYGQGYIGGDQPYIDFLNMLKRHLTNNGRIVIAIENRLGLKYFAGCTEDHLGTYFSGIENYNGKSSARTFSRRELEDIFKACDLTDYHFYYPYPDYKLPKLIHTDAYPPRGEELGDNVRNFDRERMILFNEKQVYQSLITHGDYGTFANSFEVILGPGFDTIYCKYSNDRAPEFQLCTSIEEKKGDRRVIKRALNPKGTKHIRDMAGIYGKLAKRYEGSKLRFNPCELISDTAVFPFENGTALSDLLDEKLFAGDQEGFLSLFNEYLRRISYGESAEISDFDLVFSNILIDGDTWNVIDYEWAIDEAVPSKDLAFRAISSYLLEDERRSVLKLEDIYMLLSMTPEDVANLRQYEARFQKYVTAGNAAMDDLWHLIGKDIYYLKDLTNSIKEIREGKNHIQFYFDKGEGFSEKTSEWPRERYDKNGMVKLSVLLTKDMQHFRVDPALAPCIVRIDKVDLGTRNITDIFMRMAIPQGGALLGQRIYLFDSSDPGLILPLSEILQNVSEIGENLRITMRTCLIAEDMAQFMMEKHTKAVEGTLPGKVLRKLGF